VAVEQGLDARRIQELDKQHVLHSWSVQNQLQPLVVAGGEGRYFWDAEGNRYLDFFPGWGCNLLGHCPPHVVRAVQAKLPEMQKVLPRPSALSSPTQPDSWRVRRACAARTMVSPFRSRSPMAPFRTTGRSDGPIARTARSCGRAMELKPAPPW